MVSHNDSSVDGCIRGPIYDDGRMTDDVRRRIVERRSRFVVAALATAGMAASGCCEDKGFPQQCLSIAKPPPDSSAVEPEMCLKVAPPEKPEREKNKPPTEPPT